MQLLVCLSGTYFTTTPGLSHILFLLLTKLVKLAKQTKQNYITVDQ